MNNIIFKKIKTKLLLNSEYIDIIKNELGFSYVYLVNVNRLKIYSHYPEKTIHYIHYQEIHNKYELMVDNDNIIYLYEVKKGIHLNGNYDYKEIVIMDIDNITLYSNIDKNHVNEKIKKR